MRDERLYNCIGTLGLWVNSAKLKSISDEISAFSITKSLKFAK